MASCCQTVDYQPHFTGSVTVALAGNPNSGKTTVFNALTGLRQKVANYPGVTVEKKTGRCRLPDGGWADIIDLPGTYSLISRSPDEVVAMQVLRALRADAKAPDAVIVVVDASNLQRNLYLVSQLIELGRPLVVALNMMDIAERRGLRVSPEKLQAELGVPVVPLVGHKKKGIDNLKAAIRRAVVAPAPDWPLPAAMREEVLLVGGALAILDNEGDPQVAAVLTHAPHVALKADDHAEPPARTDNRARDDGRLRRYNAYAERLLIGDRADDLDKLAQLEPVASLLASARQRLHLAGIDAMQADVEAHYLWIEGVSLRVCGGGAPPAADSDSPRRLAFDAGTSETLDPGSAALALPGSALHDSDSEGPTLTQRVDAVLVHKFWGLIIFAVIMGILFVTLFWLAQPIMDLMQRAVTLLGNLVTTHMTAGPVKDLLTDGVFAGVGAVVVFVPQIALLFLFLAVLEDTGYLARAAFLMDRLLSKVGLHGKSFIPLLSSFACAIPGIMATRTIDNRKDRLATILVAPFMSCSARLPVYTLLIGTFFVAYGAAVQAGIMLAMYLLGIAAAVGTAWVFKRSLLKGPAAAFILEMPSYKVPQASQIARQVWVNTRAFLTKAGTTIFCLSILLWAMAYYPRLSPARAAAIGDEKAVAAAQREYSIAGRLGHVMEPVIRPLGYDWKMGVGLVGAFAAREVFVSTMGITYSVGEVEGEKTQDLATAMRADRYPNGRPVWTPLVAISLLVWFVLAMQCMSTVAIVRRETGGWGWPIFMLLYMNGLAYVLSLLVYQIGSRLIT